MKRKGIEMKLKPIVLIAAMAAGGLPCLGWAADGAEILKGQCVSCHAITKPEGRTAEKVLERKGPDLEYAGVKFNREWLAGWLQNPTVIRQGGAMYTRAVKPGAPGTPDTFDPGALQPHPKLSAADAAAATEALMALGVSDGLVKKGAFKGEPAGSMAPLLFNKLRGCSSCHSAKPGSGGASGPELYTAGARLQPDYVVEFIQNPQKFDPKIWMPHLELRDADIQKLSAYLLTLKEGASK
jgi:Cytochrome c.